MCHLLRKVLNKVCDPISQLTTFYFTHCSYNNSNVKEKYFEDVKKKIPILAHNITQECWRGQLEIRIRSSARATYSFRFSHP